MNNIVPHPGQEILNQSPMTEAEKLLRDAVEAKLGVKGHTNMFLHFNFKKPLRKISEAFFSKKVTKMPLLEVMISFLSPDMPSALSKRISELPEEQKTGAIKTSIMGDETYIVYEIERAKALVREMGNRFRDSFVKSVSGEGLVGKGAVIGLTGEVFSMKYEPMKRSFNNVKRYRPIYHEIAAKEFDRLIEYSQNGELNIDMGKVAVLTTVRIISETMFSKPGDDLTDGEIEEMNKMMDRYLDILGQGIMTRKEVLELPQSVDAIQGFEDVRRGYIYQSFVSSIEQYLNGEELNNNLVTDLLGMHGALVINSLFEPSDFQKKLIKQIADALRNNDVQGADQILLKLKSDYRNALVERLVEVINSNIPVEDKIKESHETLEFLRSFYRDYSKIIKGMKKNLEDTDFNSVLNNLSYLLNLEEGRKNAVNQMLDALEVNDSSSLSRLFPILRSLYEDENEDIDFMISDLSEALENGDLEEVKSILEDFLSLLNGYGIQDGIDASLLMFFAGNETTATAMMWALFALKRNPEVHERLTREVDTCINPDGSLDIDKVQKLPYLKAFISEVLRRYAPVKLIPRTIKTKVREKDESTGELKLVTKRIRTLFSVDDINRDANLYKYPSGFFPGHYLEGEGANIKVIKDSRGTRFTFHDFLQGCPGELFSEEELAVLVAEFSARYEVVYEPGPLDPPVISRATDKPRDNRCRLRVRQKWATQFEG